MLKLLKKNQTQILKRNFHYSLVNSKKKSQKSVSFQGNITTQTSSVTKETPKIHFPEEVEKPKPKISQFKYPLLNVLLIGSFVYLSCHLAWWYLETEEKEDELIHEIKELETEIQNLVQEKHEQIIEVPKRRGFLSWFWKGK